MEFLFKIIQFGLFWILYVDPFYFAFNGWCHAFIIASPDGVRERSFSINKNPEIFGVLGYWSLRLSLGRSSPFLSLSSGLSLSPWLDLLSVGLFGLLSSGLCLLWSIASRAFMSLNSDVVSMYCSRGG